MFPLHRSQFPDDTGSGKYWTMRLGGTGEISLFESGIIESWVIAELGEEVPVVGLRIHEGVLMHKVGPSEDIRTVYSSPGCGMRVPSIQHLRL